MQNSAADTEFLDKWRARWPEWRIALTFVDPARRADAEAWFALLQEFVDAAWSEGDPAPGIAKLGWWEEELRGWSRGARRHPLGAALQKSPAPWAALADALAALPMAREAVLAAAREPGPQPLRVSADVLRPCAETMEAVERALFGATPSVSGDSRASAGIASIGMHAAQARGADDRDAATSAEFARALVAAWPTPASTRPRRIHDALVLSRMRLLAAGRRPSPTSPLAPWSALWTSWRAARG
ncbi:MAG: phytoene/squalene synthase family protein [Xanthomonadaceae bacterium]|nr:phytoene/squalene synthase family protein [Xanthomonadaceae bacterium]